MQCSIYVVIISVNMLGIVRTSDFKNEDEKVDNSFTKSDQEDKEQKIVKEDQKSETISCKISVNIETTTTLEKICPICYIDLPDISSEDRSFFKCSIDNSEYHFNCISSWFNRKVDYDFVPNLKTCPTCRTDLSSEYINHKTEIIKYFLKNPHVELIKTFKIVFIDTDGMVALENVLSDIKIDSYRIDEILELIEPLDDICIQKFRTVFISKRLKFEKEVCSSEELKFLCDRLKSESNSIISILFQEYEMIKMLTIPQRLELFKTILHIDFSNVFQRRRSIVFFSELISSIKIIKMNENDKEKSTNKCSNMCSNNLDFFPKFVLKTIKYSNMFREKILEIIYPLFKEFKYDPIYFTAISILNDESDNLELNLKYLKKYAPPELILDAKFKFLQEYFDNDFILKAIRRYFYNSKTCIKALDFYFENIYKKYTLNSMDIINSFFYSLSIKRNSRILSYSHVLEHYLKKSIEYNAFETIEFVNLCLLLQSCFRCNISSDLLRFYKDKIESNLLHIVLSSDYFYIENARYVFNLLNDIKNESKEDYEMLDLSNTYIFRFYKFYRLLQILNPKNHFQALMKICSTTKIYQENCPIASQGPLIQKILYRPEKSILVKALYKNAEASGLGYFVKIEVILNMLHKHTIRLIENIPGSEYLNNELINYFISNINSDELQENMKLKEFSLFEYIEELALSNGSHKILENIASGVDIDRLLYFSDQITENS